MTQVLYIKANPNKVSNTFKLSDSFIEAYQRNNPNDEIITLDLYKEKIGFLTEADLLAMNDPKQLADRNHPIFKYTYQFLEAEKYVIAVPFWNLSFPAILKAYLDYICVSGVTFKYTEKGAVGLLEGKKALYITTRGGDYSSGKAESLDLGKRYIETILAFLGVQDFSVLSADRMDIIGSDVEAILKEAIEKAQNLALKF